MKLMSQEIYSDCSDQKNQGREGRFEISLSSGSQGIFGSSVFESLESNASSVRRSTAIRTRGVGCAHAATKFDIQPFNFGGMNVSGVVATWSRSCPSAHGEFLGFYGQRPFGVEHDDIRPTNGYLFEWIGDNNSLIEKGDFRANQENVNTDHNKYCSAGTATFGSGTTLVETRPQKERAQHNSNTSKYQIGFWAINVSVTHSAILSYPACDSVKAVR